MPPGERGRHSHPAGATARAAAAVEPVAPRCVLLMIGSVLGTPSKTSIRNTLCNAQEGGVPNFAHISAEARAALLKVLALGVAKRLSGPVIQQKKGVAPVELSP